MLPSGVVLDTILPIKRSQRNDRFNLEKIYPESFLLIFWFLATKLCQILNASNDIRSVILEIKTTDIKWGKNYNLLIFPLDSNFMFTRGGGDYCGGWWRRVRRHATSQTSKTNENATRNGMCCLGAGCLCLIFCFSN